MNHRCEHLRNRAMARGEGTEEYAAWVFHCRHCPDCQSELFILETLREDAEGEKVHLPREKVAQLAMMAKARYGKRRKYRVLKAIWGVVWKVSTLAAMIAFLLRIVPLEAGRRTLESPRPAMDTPVARVAASEFDKALSAGADASAVMALSPGEATYERRMVAACGDDPMDFASLLPEQAFDKRILETGKKIQRQREELNELIDHDLTGY